MGYKQKAKDRNVKVSNQIDDVVNPTTDKILIYVRKNVVALEKSINKAKDLAELNGALGEMQARVLSANLDAIIAKYVKSYSAVIDAIKKDYELVTGKLIDEITNKLIQRYIENDLERVRKRVDAYLTDVKSNAISSKIMGNAFDANASIDLIESRLTKALNTEVVTSATAIDNGLTVIAGQAQGFELFVYVGGIIETSRDFCRERDGKIFTIQEINSWDNEQGLPANIYLGGYNCRHHLSPISREIAREEFGYQ